MADLLGVQRNTTGIQPPENIIDNKPWRTWPDEVDTKIIFLYFPLVLPFQLVKTLPVEMAKDAEPT
ncbi:hypothetical protein D3C85_1733560 [compost metagenome]